MAEAEQDQKSGSSRPGERRRAEARGSGGIRPSVGRSGPISSTARTPPRSRTDGSSRLAASAAEPGGAPAAKAEVLNDGAQTFVPGPGIAAQLRAPPFGDATTNARAVRAG